MNTLVTSLLITFCRGTCVQRRIEASACPGVSQNLGPFALMTRTCFWRPYCGPV